MATQIPKPEDGDRPEGPMPDVPEDEETGNGDDPAKPAVPIEEHPEDQNTG